MQRYHTGTESLYNFNRIGSHHLPLSKGIPYIDEHVCRPFMRAALHRCNFRPLSGVAEYRTNKLSPLDKFMRSDILEFCPAWLLYPLQCPGRAACGLINGGCSLKWTRFPTRCRWDANFYTNFRILVTAGKTWRCRCLRCYTFFVSLYNSYFEQRGPSTNPERPDAALALGIVGSNAQPGNQTYDYIVVGGGAAGLVVADRLSEAGHSTLLIERGPPSSGRWIPNVEAATLPFDNWRPGWLNGTNLTRFDVPGLAQYFWTSMGNITCTDQADNPAGCVLGGSTAVNSALWWRPPAADFDENGYPDGWKSTDMLAAIDRAFSRMPATDRPSPDGILYSPEGYNVVSGALAAAGWKNVTANEVPNEKNGTFSYANYHYRFGYRNGPVDTCK
jgi:hypothetical protein